MRTGAPSGMSGSVPSSHSAPLYMAVVTSHAASPAASASMSHSQTSASLYAGARTRERAACVSLDGRASQGNEGSRVTTQTRGVAKSAVRFLATDRSGTDIVRCARGPIRPVESGAESVARRATGAWARAKARTRGRALVWLARAFPRSPRCQWPGLLF